MKYNFKLLLVVIIAAFPSLNMTSSGHCTAGFAACEQHAADTYLNGPVNNWDGYMDAVDDCFRGLEACVTRA